MAALVAGLAVASVATPVASGHAVVRPGTSRPADLQQYTLTIPTEREVATIGVDMKVPEGIGFFLVQQAPGWTTEVIRRNERIDEVRWSGSEIPPDHYATFRFIARNPIEEGAISWRIVQRYEGGEAVRWIGEADSETPAARTTIAESAVAEDVVDIQGGASTSETATTSDESSPDEDSSPTEYVALGISIVALVTAMAAVGMTALRRRG